MPLVPSEQLFSSSYLGLSAQEVEVRTKEYGKNLRPRHKRKTFWKRLWGIVSEPMLILLFAATAVYFFIGSHVETVILALSIIPVVLIEFFQESKTDKAIEILDTLLVEECQVYRDGVMHKILSEEIVPGDLVYLVAGDKVPADGVLIRSPGLMVDEAVLTGESQPVIKNNYAGKEAEENTLYQGTMVVQGEGHLVVLATGGETHYGKLGNLLEKIVAAPTPLQHKIEHLVKRLAIAAGIISLFIGAVISQTQGLVRGLLGTLTIAMSIIPEEFPIVFSVFLIMGVWRLSKRKALVRTMVMVETLGSVTTICTDKTGTLTEGSMALKKIYTQGKLFDLSGGEVEQKLLRSVIEPALLGLERVAIDPIEIETQRFAKEHLLVPDNFFTKYELQKDGSFNSETKTVSHIWRNSETGELIQYTAGAPEAVVDFSDLPGAEKKKLAKVYEDLAQESYRVIGIAKTVAPNANAFLTEKLNFVGFLVMSDPPREGVKEAVATCTAAGIRIIMITGDHALTASAIAKQIGLPNADSVILGKDLDAMPNEKLQELVKKHAIFARIRPEQKYMIVEALQANSEIVAMTGDGVNDAPALKKATVGIAMGMKGTEVARAAAGIVLLDDNFTTIVQAVEEGRRIYDNLRKAFLFLFSFHIPVVGLAVIPLLIGQGLYFLPIHVIFLELFGDPITVLGLERDPLRRGAMLEKPRPVAEPLINPALWWQIGWQAAGILGIALLFYGYGFWVGGLTIGRTMSFAVLVISQLILMLINRDWAQVKGNTLLLGLIFITFAMLHVILFVPAVSSIFHFVTLSLSEYVYVLVGAGVTMAYFNKIAQGKWKR